jgi:WD40 repeat protein
MGMPPRPANQVRYFKIGSIAVLAGTTVLAAWHIEAADQPVAGISGNSSAAFSPDGKRLATTSGTSRDFHDLIKVWDLSTGKELLTIRARSIEQILWSPDGERIYARGDARYGEKKVKAWDSASAKEIQTFTPQFGSADLILLSTDGQRLYAASTRRNEVGNPGGQSAIDCWHSDTAKEIFTISIPEAKQGDFRPFGNGVNLVGVTISPDGKRLAGLTYSTTMEIKPGDLAPTPLAGAIYIWDASSGKEVAKITHKRPMAMHNLAFSPDSKQLAVTDLRPPDRSEILIWDVASGKQAASIGIGGGDTGTNLVDTDYCTVAYSPDGKYLAVQGGMTVKVFDIATQQQRFALKQGTNVHGMAFSPDSRWLATGCGAFNEIAGSQGAVKLWDLSTGKLASTLVGHRGYVTQVVFRPDGKQLAAVNSADLRLWDIKP